MVRSKSKPEPKFRPVIERLADFDLAGNPYFRSPGVTVSSVAVTALPSDPRQSLVYVGTSAGVLFLFSINPAASPDNRLSLIKHAVIANGTPAISILVVGALGKIILLAGDGCLYLLDSLLALPAKKVTIVKGGVAVIAHRFFSINNDQPNGIVPARSSFFVASTNKKLLFLELTSNGTVVIVKEILGAVEGAIMDMVWLDDSVIFGSKSGYFLYSCVSGQCGLIFTFPELSKPRLKLLVKECRVLLLVDNVAVSVDASGQPKGGSLVFQDTPCSIAEIGSHIVVVKSSKVEVYHKTSGYCMQMVMLPADFVADQGNGHGEIVVMSSKSKVICYQKVPWEEQIKDLLRRKCYSEAISLGEELHIGGEITKEILSYLHAQVGLLLLFDLHFEEAVNHFLQSDTMQPSEIFPFIMRDPNRWSLLVPRNRYWSMHPPPLLLESVVDDGLKAIQRAIYLRKAGVETNVGDEFLVNPPSRADLLESAIKNLIRYLEVSRSKDLAPSVMEGVDTLLMYLYRALNNADDMEILASSDNSCVVEELESLLNDSGHTRTLAFLYASKGMSSKALTIWRKLARDISPNYSRDPSGEINGQEKTDMTSGQEIAVVEATNILERSSDQDLVLQHLGWVSDISQVAAVQVLISEKRGNMLFPDAVIAAIDPRKVEILQGYLQWLIEDQDSNDRQYHTMYALLLAKSSLETFEIEYGVLNSGTGTSNEGRTYQTEGSSIFESPVRERLQIFLQSSDSYDPEEVLDLIEGSELWLEKAILYRKLGQETLALQILALKLEDCEAAEQYCAEIGRPDAYIQLLEMYLDPRDGKEPMFNAAVRLLHNHGEALDPLQVLERLSPDMPLQLASDIILRMLRARHHHHLQGQLVHNLSRALDLDSSLARLEERSRHVLINDESVCGSCHARLGTKLFAVYPDDTIVCYKCFRRQEESKSVTGCNPEEDILYKPGWLVTRPH